MATINRVIDGDTAVLDVDLGFYTYMRLHFRFYGINTPERGKPGWTEATEYVKAFFAKNPTVLINCHGMDKYGRWLGEFVLGDTTLNKSLVDAGLAVPYFP